MRVKTLGTTIKCKMRLLFFFLTCFLLQNTQAHAWNVSLENNLYLPKKFIAVSKTNKELYVIEENKSNEYIDIEQSFPAIYGEAEGDKKREGDLKTPEGVYFITKKIDYKLDFDEYGTGAYALNYPNPIDRIKRKTGSGIWIHSKGQPIEGQATRGCIAVDLEHFPVVANNLPSGTPVVVANSLLSINEPLAQQDRSILLADASGNGPILDAGKEKSSHEFVGTYKNTNTTIESASISEKEAAYTTNFAPQTVIDLTKEWNKAWEEMSDEFFDFYDEKKYTLAQGSSYEGFQSQKETLFKRLDWIDIEYGDIYALEGTDYWVTWFEQLYRASNLSTEGIRRLYWQLDENNQYKVVAMEWIPRDLGLEKAYKEALAKEAQMQIEAWQKAWLIADVDAYATYYTADAIQGNRKGEAIFKQKASLWKSIQPKVLDFDNFKYTLDGHEMKVVFNQSYTDSRGYSDYGQKILTMRKVDNEWRIAKEDWRKLDR